jgi:hypothetical protein
VAEFHRSGKAISNIGAFEGLKQKIIPLKTGHEGEWTTAVGSIDDKIILSGLLGAPKILGPTFAVTTSAVRNPKYFVTDRGAYLQASMFDRARWNRVPALSIELVAWAAINRIVGRRIQIY